MILLGSTGSIGVNTLNIAREFGLSVDTLAAGTNMALLRSQIEEFHPKTVVVGSLEAKERLGNVKAKLLVGEEGILEAIRHSGSELVVNALVGFLGLAPTYEALRLEKRVALANKESLVAAGAFLDTSNIVPIDSEHFALWYLLSGRPVSRMVITASGGAFRDTPLDHLATATVADALAHPNWSMGRKITVDSATMANKLFELLEARWLFGGEISYDALIEPRSLVHAMVEFTDGVTTMQLSTPDMRLPIAYALLGHMERPLFGHIDMLKLGELSFHPIDPARYPLWQLKEELLANPAMGVVLNTANEVAVAAFLEGRIGYTAIASSVLNTFEHFSARHPQTLDEVFDLDREVRAVTL